MKVSLAHGWRARLRCGSCAALLGCLLGSPQASAQRHFDAEAFDPAPAQEGSVLRVYGARSLAPGGYSLGIIGSYARKPLSIRDSNDKALGDLAGSIGTVALLGTVGLFDRVDLGIALPLHRVSAGSQFQNAPPPAVIAALVDPSKVALGDIRLVPRVALLQREQRSGLGLALLAPISLPTGDKDVYAGEALRIEPRLALDYACERLLLSANVGYLVREAATVLGSKIDDMLRWGVGADVTLVGALSGLVELSGALNVMSDDFRKNDAPTEGLLGLRWRDQGFLAQLGAGTGLVRGITAPEYRLFASVGFAAEPKKEDPDPDHDGVLGSQDACPGEPEDRDGFEDSDGCPDPDNDKDGIPDAADKCPAQAEDIEGLEDDDGCPELDHDKDGIPDAADKCPGEAEDRDNFEDDDGCPDPDNDKDGILDADDKCPGEAGVAEQQGCPAPAPTHVEVTEQGVELKQSVAFGFDSAKILDDSLPLMDELAKVLTDHRELTLVVVEGHSDDQGPREHNLALSKKRAQAVVDALVARGVATERLKAEGYGPDKPLIPNTSRANRMKNRRVQLRIEQRDTAAK